MEQTYGDSVFTSQLSESQRVCVISSPRLTDPRLSSQRLHYPVTQWSYLSDFQRPITSTPLCNNQPSHISTTSTLTVTYSRQRYSSQRSPHLVTGVVDSAKAINRNNSVISCLPSANLLSIFKSYWKNTGGSVQHI